MKRWVGCIAFVTILFFEIMPLQVSGLANVSQSFLTTDSNIVPGNLVSTDRQVGRIVLASTDNASRLAGVVVSTAGSLLAIDSSPQGRKAQVAISGIANTYVSTFNGDINVGDQISVSPLSGIGMEATSGLRVVGIAQASFSSNTKGVKSYEVKDKTGSAHKVVVGSIPIVINVGSSNPSSSAPAVISDLQAFAMAIVGHQVSVLQAVLSFLIAIVAIAALIALVYGAIQGGIVAIGRNPLARESIYKSLLQVMATAILIVVITAILLYLTLR